MKILLNYADGRFLQSQFKNSQTGLAAGFNVVYQMSKADIDPVFAKENESILSQKRGAGYWLWKPYFINRIISGMTESDVLFYADSGSFFIKSVHGIFESLHQDRNGVLCFNLSGKHIEKFWTKRDVFKKLGLTSSEFTDTPQRMASFMVFKGTEYAKNLVREYLTLCCDSDLILDSANSDGWVEPGFKDHRHDQSIWSLLTKKYGITMLHDPTQWGVQQGENTEVDQYIFHTRDPN